MLQVRLRRPAAEAEQRAFQELHLPTKYASAHRSYHPARRFDDLAAGALNERRRLTAPSKLLVRLDGEARKPPADQPRARAEPVERRGRRAERGDLLGERSGAEHAERREPHSDVLPVP